MSNLTKGRKKQVKETAPRSKKQVDISERRWLVLELRKQGGSYREIASQLVEQFGATGEHGVTPEYSHQLAYKDFKDALEDLNKRNADALEDNRELDLQRLDSLLAAHMDSAASGDAVATDKVLAIIKERAAWFGYNAPVKMDVKTQDVTDIPDTERLERLLALANLARARRGDESSSRAGGDT